ncbi:MAG: xanthine phosphoribosyltransferase [Acholeplasmatales bacterium]|nr:xanthine phosphoribosyltransferase [Acholeplasmatales bacterium]
MKLLEDEIRKRGQILPGNVLKVNSFLNHKIDPMLLEAMAEEWYQKFKNEDINKVVTIESSGIAMAILVALKFKCELVFAKKGKSSTLGNVMTASVYSFTKEKDVLISIENGYIREDDNVLIIDDFLANGSACNGLISIIKYAKANVKGIGIAIEKGFQDGGKLLRSQGYKVESLAIIKSMNADSGTIEFMEAE